MDNPTTLPEWEIYIGQLSGADLWSKAVNANTLRLVKALLFEGMDLAEIEQIMVFFVRRLMETEVKIPEGGMFDLVSLARTDPIARGFGTKGT